MWLLFFPLFALADETPKLTVIDGGGKVVSKTEKKSFSEHCSAERRWFELENAGKGSAKINAAFRKESTVGRELKAGDCPSREDTEELRYFNDSYFVGQKGRVVSASLFVYFPGGSGRYARRCNAFSLDSGKSVHLEKLLTEAGSKKLAEAYCKVNPTQAKYCATYAKQACLLVTADGVRAELPGPAGWKFAGPVVFFPWPEVAEVLRLPAKLKSELGL